MALNIDPHITRGDSASWTASYDGYLPLDGWGAVLHLSGVAGTELTGVVEADGWRFDLSAAVSATMGEGNYGWAVVLTKAPDRKTVETGRLIIAADPAGTGAGHDPRSDYEVALDNIVLVLKGKAGTDVLNYSINGRALSHYSFEELIKAEQYFRSKVEAEKANRDGRKLYGGHVVARFR